MNDFESNPFQQADINTYEEQVETFIAQASEIRERAGGKPRNLPDYDRAILDGIEKHLQAVARLWINSFDAETLRRFYPEMRRIADARHRRMAARQSAERICSECGGVHEPDDPLPF